jgi:hypothetical protein
VRLAEVNGSADIIARDEVVLTGPLTNINKILGIGLNYKDGAAQLVSKRRTGCWLGPAHVGRANNIKFILERNSTCCVS